VREQNRTASLKFGGAMLVALLLVATWFAQPAMGVTPPVQGERPVLPPPPPDPSGGEAEGEEAVPAGNCAGLSGTVVNWGFQNEPGVTLRLGDGGWETTQVTSDDGSYQFGSLGQGVAFLSIDLPSKQAETLRPMADNVAIRLRCENDVIANLGLYSSPSRPNPPAVLTMGVSQATVRPGDTVTFYLTLENGMPHAISHVFVTDFTPDGLTVVDVKTTRGAVEVLNERMVTVNTGDLPQGAQETIQIVAQADPDLSPGARLTNTATLLYAESAADQAWATLTVGGGVGVAPTATMAVDESPTPAPPTPLADETPGPGDELLPVTGGGIAAALPVAGFVLALLVLGLRQLRERPAPK
jgi:uncharacterized repeat protein (TIGR01451 family)